MNRLIFLILFIPSWVLAQESSGYDSLPTYLLSEVTIQSTSAEDTLQNFFRANKSATTEDILSRLHGVYLIRRGSYGQEPMLQGMSGGQLNVTIDGMKMFGACTDKMDPVTIYVEPQNLKGMRIMQGSGGSEMGSTVGGSIDMQLAQPQLSSQTFYGQAGVGYQGVSNGINSYVNGNYSTKNSAYNFGFNYRKANNYKDGEGQEVLYSQYEKINFTGGAKWHIGSDTLIANVLIDNGWNIGYPALPMDVGSAKAKIFALTYERDRCHGLVEKFRIKAYYNSIFHSMDDTHRSDVVMHMDMPGESKTTGIFGEGNLRRLGNHSISFRTDFYYNHVLAEMTMYPEGESPMYMQTWPSSGRAVSGLYLSDNYSISASTNVKADARIDFAFTSVDDGIGKDQLEVFYPNTPSTSSMLASSFNLRLQQLWGKSMIAEVHAGYGERLPTLSETYGFYLFNQNDGYDYIGNVSLQTEKSWSGDLSLTYFTNALQVGVTGFYKYLPDYIFAKTAENVLPMTPGANGVKVYENISFATFAGGDVTILGNLSPAFRLVNTTKYTVAKDDSKNPLPLIPPLTNITTLQYWKKLWNIQVECEAALPQEKINPSFGEDTTPGFAVINLRGGYTFRKQRLLVNGGLENVLDTFYHSHLDWGNIPRPGRNLYASLTLSF